jgi:hypothetical protein
MDKGLETAYLQELDGQANFALLALADMRKSHADLVGGDQGAGIRFWSSVQSFLMAVANISKILFPKTNPRGGHLRNLVGVSSGSPLDYTNRGVRDSYEHIDERLETWWNTSADKRRADYNIYPTSALHGLIGGSNNCLRHFDPNTNTLTFQGNSLEILPVEKAIVELKQKIAPLLSAS